MPTGRGYFCKQLLKWSYICIAPVRPSVTRFNYPMFFHASLLINIVYCVNNDFYMHTYILNQAICVAKLCFCCFSS